MKRYDLMQNINTRGTFLVIKECLPYLLKSSHAHILNMAPPLLMAPNSFAPHVAYTIAKFGMSMCVLGMAEEFKDQGIAVNALWPRRIVYTAATDFVRGKEAIKTARNVDIMADAAYGILIQDTGKWTGQFFLDEDVLTAVGVKDLKQYSCVPGNENLRNTFFTPDTAILSKL